MIVPILTDAVRAHARATPDKPFIHFATREDGSTITYGALMEEASRFARLYTARGARPGEIVLISLKTSRDLIAAFVGGLLAGCVPSMMPFPSSKQDTGIFWSSHNALFRHLGGGLIVTYPDNIPAITRNIDAAGMRIVCSAEAQLHADGAAVDVPDRARADLACLQHSSGTTGLKKGIPLTFGDISAQIGGYSQDIGLSSDDVIASWLPLYHDMGFVACFLMPLSLGATVVMLDPFEWIMAPVTLLRVIARHDARYAWMPNFAFNHLANTIPDDQDRVDLSRIRALINCSEPCQASSFDRFVARFASWGIRREQLQVCYAMAEAVFAVTQTPLGAPPRLLSLATVTPSGQAIPRTAPAMVPSAGRPLPGVEIRIHDADGSPAAEGGIGEIGLAGAFIFRGYHECPTHDPALFRDGFYLTSDIGVLRDGELYVLGRKHDLIIVCGTNFFAHDIEAILGRVPGIKPGRAVALGILNEELGSEDVVIVAEKAPAAMADERVIRREIRQSLKHAFGLAPQKIMLVDEGWLIKSTSGKISRNANLDKYLKTQTRLPSAEVTLPRFPNFGAIKRENNIAWPPAADDVHIQTDFFKALLRLALEHVQVDDRYYLRTYPDVVEALEKGLFTSPRHHYLEFGYYEDRLPFRVEVDEEFYFRSNPDIKATVTGGLLPSAQVHFERHGYKEGRLPREGWHLFANAR